MNEGDTYAGVATIHPNDPHGELHARETLVRDLSRRLASMLGDGHTYAIRIRIDGPHPDEAMFPHMRQFGPVPQVMRAHAEIYRVAVEPHAFRLSSPPDPRELSTRRLVPTASAELWSRAKRAAARMAYWR